MSALDPIAAGFDDPRVAAAFTTRSGGVSEGPFKSLNLSWSRGDDKSRVEENRRRVAQMLGGLDLVFANQVHGDTVLKVDASPVGVWSAGEGDALMTDQPSLGLCAQTADCTPILLFDPERPAVAAIHSGWRGTVQDIGPKTLAAMGEAYGTRPQAVYAAIGPSISKANYRVGPEVLDQFEAMFGTLDDSLIGPRDSEGGAGLDVAEACLRRLVHAGVPNAQISVFKGCTFAQEARFFSSRRAARDGHAGQFGGQVGVIGLKLAP